MGWIADGSGDTGRRLVHSLVNELTNYLETKSYICQDYAGQAKKCCDDIYQCFKKLKNTLLDIKANSQDVDSACRQIQSQLNEVSKCVDVKTSHCHFSLSKSNIRTPFYQAIRRLTDIYDGYCTKSTSERPTTTTITESQSTITPTTVTEVSSTPTTMLDKTTSSSDVIVDANNGYIRSGNVTTLPEGDDDTIIIASSAVGATVFVIVVVMAIVFFCLRKRKPIPGETDTTSANSKRGFIWRWLHTSKPDTQYADSEIYTEIDEAFLDAVYQLSHAQRPKKQDKIHHTAQINICYGTGMEDDIIQSNDNIKPPLIESDQEVISPPLLSEYETPIPLNAHDLIRKHDVITTSFNSTTGTSIHDMKTRPSPGYQNVPKGISSSAVLVLPNQKGFIQSRPAFTAITQSTSNDYVQIEAREVQEMIYSELSDNNSIYDTTVTFDHNHKYLSKSSNVYNKPYENTNYEHTGEAKRKQNKRHSSEFTEIKTSPNYIYENPCLEY